jgi:hypothetical protein
MSEYKPYPGLDIVIEYEHDPGEKTVYYRRDGSGSPGYPPSIDIIRITADGGREDIADNFTEDELEGFCEEIMKAHQEDFDEPDFDEPDRDYD